MTALHWVRNDKSPAWILRPVAPCAGGFIDLRTRYTWTHAQPIAEGHPDADVDAQLAEAYRAREMARRGPVIEEIAHAPRKRNGILAFFTGGK